MHSFNDNEEWVLPTVIVIATFLQIVPPIIHYFFAYRKKCQSKAKQQSERKNVFIALNAAEARMFKLANELKTAKDEEKKDMETELEKARQEEQTLKAKYEKLDRNSRKSGCGALFMRIVSIYLGASFWIWLTFLIGCGATKCGQHGTIFVALMLMSLVVIPIAAIFIMIEACTSIEARWIRNYSVLPDSSMTEYIQRLRQTTPKIVLRVQCYNYETRTFATQEQNDVKIHTCQERVMTNSDKQEFAFDDWKDVSPSNVDSNGGRKLTRLHLSKVIRFGSQETYDAYLAAKKELEGRNWHKGCEMDTWTEIELDGYVERVTTVHDKNQNSWWLSLWCYYVASMLCCTWPYRLLLKLKTSKASFILTKEVFVGSSSDILPPPTLPFLVVCHRPQSTHLRVPPPAAPANGDVQNNDSVPLLVREVDDSEIV